MLTLSFAGVGTALNHFSMDGKLLMSVLAMTMLIEVPLWLLATNALYRFGVGIFSNLIAAIIVAIPASLIVTAHHYEPLIAGNINETTKKGVLLWYIGNSMNLLMAIACALIFTFLSYKSGRLKGVLS
jgi:hypothetical protein